MCDRDGAMLGRENLRPMPGCFSAGQAEGMVTSARLMSSKLLRSQATASAMLDEWNDDDLDDLESVRSGGEPGEGERTAMETIRGRRRGLSKRRAVLVALNALGAAGAIKTSGVATSQSAGDGLSGCLCVGREGLLLERRWRVEREGVVAGAKECRRENGSSCCHDGVSEREEVVMTTEECGWPAIGTDS